LFVGHIVPPIKCLVPRSRCLYLGVRGVCWKSHIEHEGTRDKINLEYISRCKPHLTSRIYGVELGLKSA